MSDRDAAHVSAELLGIVARSHPNILLTGPDWATVQAVDRIREHLRRPIETWFPPEAQALPDKRRCTLLIPAIDTADDDQQAQLSAWLEIRVGLVQVVAMSVTPLFLRVERGIFQARLYYGLNHVYVDLTGTQES